MEIVFANEYLRELYEEGKAKNKKIDFNLLLSTDINGSLIL